MQFTAGFLSATLMSWINSKFVIAAVRRQLLINWTSHLMEAMQSRPQSVEEPFGNFTLVLERLCPHEHSLADLFRTIWAHVVQPTLHEKDEALALLDGCVTLRIGEGCVKACPSFLRHGPVTGKFSVTMLPSKCKSGHSPRWDVAERRCRPVSSLSRVCASAQA